MAVLDSGPGAARTTACEQLVVDRLDMTQTWNSGYYDFVGTGTLLPVIAGVVPPSGASPPGFAALWEASLAGRIERHTRLRDSRPGRPVCSETPRNQIGVRTGFRDTLKR